MSRYNPRPLPHRNMQNQNVEENPAQAEQIVNPGPLEQNNDLLSELRIISQELSSLGTLNRITPLMAAIYQNSVSGHAMFRNNVPSLA